MKKLAFDTLEYMQQLEAGEVEHADVHASSLADALTQNIYTKMEVDQMYKEALEEFVAQNQKMREEFNKSSTENKFEMKDIENRFEKAINRSAYMIISVLGALIVMVGAISTFAHHLT